MKSSSRRQAKKAAKARLSGAIPSASKSPKNKKVVFGDSDDDESIEDVIQMQQSTDGDEESQGGSDFDAIEDVTKEDEKDEPDSAHDDDAVEEIKGSAARQSTKRMREAERKIAKDTLSKKKRKKKSVVAPSVDAEKSEDESEEDEDLLTEDFFKMVDSERADRLQNARQEKKTKRAQEKKRLGRHTTFVVEDEYKTDDAPHKMDQNIEVVALGGGESNNNETNGNAGFDERELLISTTLGAAPSKAAVAFARGSMACGTSKDRSSDSRKRKSKNEETWKRSRTLNKLGFGSRPGRAAALFVRKK